MTSTAVLTEIFSEVLEPSFLSAVFLFFSSALCLVHQALPLLKLSATENERHADSFWESIINYQYHCTQTCLHQNADKSTVKILLLFYFIFLEKLEVFSFLFHFILLSLKLI